MGTTNYISRLDFYYFTDYCFVEIEHLSLDLVYSMFLEVGVVEQDSLSSDNSSSQDVSKLSLHFFSYFNRFSILLSLVYYFKYVFSYAYILDPLRMLPIPHIFYFYDSLLIFKNK